MSARAQKRRPPHFDSSVTPGLRPTSAVRKTLSGPGRPLEPGTRREMETRFRHDFSGVRVHTGPEAAESARAVNAVAYTLGRDVVFGEGKFAPATKEGKQLIAHELMHVAQQSEQPEAAQSIHRQPAQDEGPGPVAKGAGNVSVTVGATMTSEAGLREVYRKAAREISDEALRRVASGEPLEQAARWAHAARNELKAAIRARGSDIVRALAEARNIKKYGDKIGPSYEQLIREGKTPQDIIGSAGKASQKVNRAAARIKVGGGFLIAVDLAIVTWDVISAPEGQRLRTAVSGGASVAGAAGGGWAGMKGGAAVGSFFGPAGTVIGGAVGAVGGALLGGWLGGKAGEKAYDMVDDLVNPPKGSSWDLQTIVIDAIEEEYIRSQAGGGK